MTLLSARACAALSPRGAVGGGGANSPTATDDRAVTVIAIERAHGQVIFGFVRRLGVDDDAAADVVQESLLRLYDRLVAGDTIDDPRAWVFHAAYRLAMDEHRRFDRRRRLNALLSGVPVAASADPASAGEGRLVWRPSTVCLSGNERFSTCVSEPTWISTPSPPLLVSRRVRHAATARRRWGRCGLK